MGLRIILASGSPRRAEILDRLGIEYQVRAQDVDESLAAGEHPGVAAERLARVKAEKAARAGFLSIGCDTLVAFEGHVLGKPLSAEHAREMLARLAGREHVVYTGVAVAAGDRTESAVERTRVWFRHLDAGQIGEYVQTGEPLDKAGAYGIQGFGAAIVQGVEGDFFNVMGLPVLRMLELFGRYGWRYAFQGWVRTEGEDDDR